MRSIVKTILPNDDIRDFCVIGNGYEADRFECDDAQGFGSKLLHIPCGKHKRTIQAVGVDLLMLAICQAYAAVLLRERLIVASQIPIWF